MVTVGTEEIAAMMAGEIGIKTVMAGNEEVYQRPGAYVYIQLETKGE